MRSLFNKAQNAQLSTDITSDEVVLSGLSGVTRIETTTSGATLILNDQTGTSFNAVNGDRLKVRLRSSAAYAATKFAIISLGNETVLFTVTTVQDPAKFNYAGFADLTPLELTKYQSGQDYIPNPVDNVLSMYNVDGSFIKSIPAKAPATPGTTTNDVIVVADYYSKNILKIDAVTHEVVRAIEVGERPYGVAHTPTSDTNADSLTWVSVSEEDKVVVLDKNHNLVATHHTGEKPMGIAVTIDGKHLFVANNADDTLTHFSLNGEVWSSVDIAVGAKPFEVATDLRGNAWVSCTGTDKIYRITRDNIKTEFVVGGGPRGLILDSSGNVWVALAKENTVAKLVPSTGVVTKVATRQVPFALAAGKEGSIFVSNFGDSTIQRIQNGAVTHTFEVGRYPYGMTVDASGRLYVATLYSNTPQYLYDADQTPLGFGVQDQLTVRPSTLVTSNTITIAEVNTATPVSVPPLYSAKIIKNGEDAGVETTVMNGDTIAYSFVTPAQYDTKIDMPIFIGTRSDSFVSTIPPEDVTPGKFFFTDKNNAAPEEWYTSNEVTVSAIDTTARINATTSSGTLVINGVNSGASSITVKLDDKIAIRAQALPTIGETLYATLNVGGVEAVWRVNTNVVDTGRYIKPEFKNTDRWAPTLGFRNASLDAKLQLTRIAIDNYAMTSWPLTVTETWSEGAAVRYVAVPDRDAVYAINTATGDVRPVLSPELGASSATRFPFKVVGNRFALCKLSSSVYDLQTGGEITLPSVPQDASFVGGKLYVAMLNGTVAVLESVSSAYAITANIAVCDNAYSIRVDSGFMWVSDPTTDSLHRVTLDGTGKAGTLSGEIENAGGDVWSITSNATHLWTANSYDNTVSKINKSTLAVEKTIRVGSAPNHIALDSSGRVWVSHYGSSNVIVLDAGTNAVLQDVVLNYAPALALDSTTGYIWAAELYNKIDVVQDKLVPLTQPPIVFESLEDVALSNTVTTSPVVIADLVRPIKLTLRQLPGHKLRVNGIEVTSAIVDNSDTVSLEMPASADYFTETVATVYSPYAAHTFTARTVPDIYPDNVMFTPLFDIYVRQRVISDTVTITGMSEGATCRIQPSDPEWRVILNGVEAQNGSFVEVTNGDRVALVGNTRGQYGTSVEYKLMQYLGSTTEGEEGTEDITLGTLSITHKTLDGPVPAAGKFTRVFKPEWYTRPYRRFKSGMVAPLIAVQKPHARRLMELRLPVKLVQSVRAVSESQYERHVTAVKAVDIPIDYAVRVNRKTLEVGIATNYVSKHHRVQHVGQTIALNAPIVPLKVTRQALYVADPVSYERQGGTSFASHPVSVGYEADRDRAMPTNTAAYERNYSYLQRTVAAAYERNYLYELRQFDGQVQKEGEKRGSYDWRTVVPEYERHGSEGAKLSEEPLFDKRSSVMMRTFVRESEAKHGSIMHTFERGVDSRHGSISHTFEAGVTSKPHRSRHLSDPQAMASKVYSLHTSQPVEYVAKSKRNRIAVHMPFPPPVAITVVRTIRNVDVVQYETSASRTQRTAEAAYSSPTPRPMLQFESSATKLVRQFSSVDVSFEKVARPAKLVEASYTKLVGSYALMPAREAYSKYVVHNYTVDEDAATEGAYETREAAVEAGRAAGYPKAFAYPLPRGHWMWVTPMDREAPPPPLFPIPEKWYVHGG